MTAVLILLTADSIACTDPWVLKLKRPVFHIARRVMSFHVVCFAFAVLTLFIAKGQL